MTTPKAELHPNIPESETEVQPVEPEQSPTSEEVRDTQEVAGKKYTPDQRIVRGDGPGTQRSSGGAKEAKTKHDALSAKTQEELSEALSSKDVQETGPESPGNIIAITFKGSLPEAA